MEQRNSSIEIYRSPEGNIELNVKLENDTVWLTQSQMAELFGRDRTVISRHVNNCFKEGELDPNITCAKFAHMGIDGDQTYETTMYNLDVIISVGYRVKSINGTRFRQWANSILKQYIIKGYAINQKRLDNYNELKEVVSLMGIDFVEHPALRHIEQHITVLHPHVHPHLVSYAGHRPCGVLAL